MKFFHPTLYYSKISDISIEKLVDLDIKGLIIDVDNTILDFDGNIAENLDLWHKSLEQAGIKSYIVSNSFNKDKVSGMANRLGIHWFSSALKPFPMFLSKACKIMDLNKKNVAVVGDQIFTDVLGAKFAGCKSILVDPMLEKKDYLVTKIKRPLEKKIISSLTKEK